MNFFKRAIPSPVQIDIAVPDSISHDDVFLGIEVTLMAATNTIKPVVKARLRADITDKKKAHGAAQYYLLGEVEYPGEVVAVPDKPEKLAMKIPLDFSPMSMFDVPAENIAMASPEMQAAMTAAQEINDLYTYSVEVVVKTETGEFVARAPTKLIRPDSTRIGNF